MSQAPPRDWKARVAEFGKVGIVAYIAIYASFILGFYLALGSPSVRAHPWIAPYVSEGGLWVSAWLIAKMLMVPRAALTCAVTPLVLRWLPSRS